MSSSVHITDARFEKGIIGTDPILKKTVPHIVFAGRSNVGKSSLINSLLARKHLAKSSATPGKTQQINFFPVTVEIKKRRRMFYFVDLPGYGFARLSEKRREKLRKLILWYLEYSGVIPQQVVLIVDAKVGPTPFDKEMFGVLEKHGYQYIVVANKIDKVPKTHRVKYLTRIQEVFQGARVIPYSAKTQEGREELLNVLFR